MSRNLSFADLIKFLYTHNPFYLLSVLLFLYSLHVSFPAGEIGSVDPWSRMRLLCAYTSIMAVTAFLVVRIGKVWDDARSILLLLLLLFVAIAGMATATPALYGSLYGALERMIAVRGAQPLAWAIVFFFIAALISALKGGLRVKLELWISPTDPQNGNGE